MAKAVYSATYVDPFDSFKRSAAKFDGHRQTRLSWKQRETLVRNGYDPDRMSVGDALARHWQCIRASDRQRAVLYRFYPRADVDKMPKWEAARCLDALAKNGWRRP